MLRDKTKIVVYENDVSIHYKCGCEESKLEVLPWESPYSYCKVHKQKVRK